MLTKDQTTVLNKLIELLAEPQVGIEKALKMLTVLVHSDSASEELVDSYNRLTHEDREAIIYAVLEHFQTLNNTLKGENK